MSIYYPEDLDERRAGITTETITRHVECPQCGWNGDLDMNTTGHTAHWTCDACDIEHEIEVNE